MDGFGLRSSAEPDSGILLPPATEADAYQAGVEAFGVEGGFVIAQVVAAAPTPINPAATFGLGRA